MNRHKLPARAHRSGRHRNSFVVEPLEPRCLLAAVGWDGGGDGTTWTDPLNWDTNTVPTAADDATINVTANPTVVLGADRSVRSLTTAEAVVVTGSSTLAVTHGMTLVSGATVTLGNGAAGVGRLEFSGTQTLGGTGEVIFSTTAFTGYVRGQSGVLTIGPGVTLRGGNGEIVAAGSGNAVINQGMIVADVPDRTITIHGTFINQGTLRTDTGATLRFTDGATWSNEGTLSVQGGRLNLGGTFTLSPGGTFVRNGGTVYFTGTLNNTGQTLVLNASTGSWNLHGGVINGGTVGPFSDGATLVVTGGSSLSGGVTLNEDLTLTEQYGLAITGGLTLGAGVTVTLAAHGSGLGFRGTQTLGGTGEVVFDTASPSDRPTIGADSGVVTIGPGVTVRGGNGLVAASGGTLVNRGTIVADTAGRTLTIGGLGWRNEGTLSVQGGTLNLGGTFTLPPGGTFVRNGGTVNLIGSLNNAGRTLVLDASTGSWNLAGGWINGGTVGPFLDGATLVVTNSTGISVLNGGVTLNEDLVVGHYPLVVMGGLTLGAGTTITLGYEANSGGRLDFEGTQTLGGAGEVVFNSTATPTSLQVRSTSGVLTIGLGITVRGGNGSVQALSGTSVVNRGTIVSDVSGRTIVIQNAFTNQGTVRVDAGATLTFQNGTWSNAGTLDVQGGTLNLGGTFTLPPAGMFLRNGGTVNITGTLNNTGRTLVLDASTGSWNLTGGTIMGGAVGPFSGGATLTVTGGSGLSGGVTLNDDLTVTGSTTLTVMGGLTLGQGAVVTLGNGTTGGRLEFSGTQTLGGTGEVLFNDLNNAGDQWVRPSTSGTTLTIGPGVMVHGGDGTVGTTIGGRAVVNQGTISADVTGRTVRIEGAFTNTGTVQAAGGALVVQPPSPGMGVPGTFTNAGVIGALPGSTLTVQGNLLQTGTAGVQVRIRGFTAGDIGQIVVTGEATLAGNVTVTGVDGFVPECVNVGFFIAGVRTGEFDTRTLPPPPAGHQSLVVYSGPGVRFAISPLSDYNQDGVLNSNDYFVFLDNFFKGDGDFNGDGVTNSDDYFEFLTSYFEGCP